MDANRFNNTRAILVENPRCEVRPLCKHQQQMVLKAIPLVFKFFGSNKAKIKYANRIEYDDYKQYLCAFICEAAQRCDPEMSTNEGGHVKFSTYCIGYVHGKLQNLQKALINNLNENFVHESEIFYNCYYRVKSLAVMNLQFRSYLKAWELWYLSNVNFRCEDDEKQWLADGLVDEYLDTLSERQRKIVKMYFGIGGKRMTLAKIGEKEGITKERTRQIISSAIMAMKHKMKADMSRSSIARDERLKQAAWDKLTPM